MVRYFKESVLLIPPKPIKAFHGSAGQSPTLKRRAYETAYIRPPFRQRKPDPAGERVPDNHILIRPPNLVPGAGGLSEAWLALRVLLLHIDGREAARLWAMVLLLRLATRLCVREVARGSLRVPGTGLG